LYADCLTSGVDRPVLKLRGTIYYHNNQLITHPLSSSHIKISLPDDLEKILGIFVEILNLKKDKNETF